MVNKIVSANTKYRQTEQITAIFDAGKVLEAGRDAVPTYGVQEAGSSNLLTQT